MGKGTRVLIHWPGLDAGVCANLRESQSKPDLSLVFCDAPAVSAGVFTQNVVCAAPVTYCKSLLSNKKTARAVRV